MEQGVVHASSTESCGSIHHNATITGYILIQKIQKLVPILPSEQQPLISPVFNLAESHLSPH